jgi:DNA replication licensing factor MCM5
MVIIPGIITSASKTHIKATTIGIKCMNCGHQKQIKLNQGFGGAQLPRICDKQNDPGLDKQKCKLDSYQITDQCVFMD